jgi:hypothetical protein
MVTALIVALAVGVFFATPLRNVLTGPDEVERVSREAQPSARTDDPPTHGPWSTAAPKPDQKWPSPRRE